VTDVWMGGWMDVVNLFSNRYFSYSFCMILSKIGTHDLFANTKKLSNRFSKFCFKNLWEIFKILRQQRSCLG